MTSVPWFVYVLLCSDETLYCGATNNLKARLAAHNNGTGAKYTKGRGPCKLLWFKELPDKSSAFKLEAAIKKLSRPNKFEFMKSN